MDIRRKRFARSWLTAVVLLIGLGCGPSPKPPVQPPTPATTADEPTLPRIALRAGDEPTPPKPAPHAVAKEWYSPREADFRPEYDRDMVNQSKETWDDYWSWVKTYYQGNLFSSGWTDQATAVLSGVRSEQARDELRSDLNELGRRVAGEWAKSNRIHKIDIPTLRAYGGRLTKAAKLDDGSGQAIREEVQWIRGDVDARLNGH